MSEYTVNIEVDIDPLHPRRDCENNFGMLYTFPRFPYDIGDYHNETTDSLLNLFTAFKNAGVPVLPVFMFDHSGQTFYTEAKGDQWDESHVGFIFLHVGKFLEQVGGKKMSAKRRELALQYLREEVEEVSRYHNTTYYVASIWDNDDPDYVIDSMSGFESEAEARRWAGDLLGAMDV